MEIYSDGIFLTRRLFGESQQIVRIFSQNSGLVSGVVRLTSNPKRGALYQLGDHVRMQWRARLEDHLGQVTLERQANQYISALELPALALQALMSMGTLLQAALSERVREPVLYQASILLLEQFATKNWARAYLEWERKFLEAMGFGLDLTQCAAGCDRRRFDYVSPKSGKAVCARHAEPYRERLLSMPLCWREVDDVPHSNTVDMADIVAGLQVTGHFLAREIFPEGNSMPEFRRNLLEKLHRNP